MKGMTNTPDEHAGTNPTFSLDVYRPDGTQSSVGFYPANPRTARINAIKLISNDVLLVAVDRYFDAWSSKYDPNEVDNTANPDGGWYAVDLKAQTHTQRAFFGASSQNPMYTTQDLGCDETPTMRGWAPRGDGTREEDEFDSIVCFNRADRWRNFWKAPNGSAYVHTGRSVNNDFCNEFKNYSNCVATGALLEVWPRVNRPQLSGLLSTNPVFTNVTSVTPVLGSVFANGVTPSGKFRTVLFDLEQSSSREMISEEANVLVLMSSFSASCNCILFIGSQGYGGDPLLGSVDLNTGRLSITEGIPKLSDLQSFSNSKR
jgi:hypothetical protein